MGATTADIKSIFGKALALRSPAEQAAYLEEACGNNPRLRAEVESLLQAHQEAGSFLGDPEPSLLATVDAPSVSERPGTIIGPYRLLEEVGEGGMGLVFVAEQQYPVRRKVALKLIKPGMDTRLVVARFEAERQALALMDHPHIARVLDAGETVGGRPYFVMELVRGVPITQFCDGHRLTPRQRLELFVSVCAAVQHAHTKGIIHRDLKPSNVLVALHDATPMVKVIDFGVAKAVGQQLTDKTLFTGVAQMVGTPLYMSPEQAGLSGLDIDTRSDIYSLGVLLYELLTGTTPFEKERLQQASYEEIRRIIREEEPPRPSTRISTLGHAAATASANRQSDPRRLRQLCRGELDWVVLKALEKDRDRRYETASAFAADVQRYLADQPVAACPPSAGYRLRKFVRRNRGPVLAAGALVLALAAVAAVATAGYVQTEAARATAQERADALAASLYTQRVAFVDRLLSADDRARADELLDPCPPELRGWEWGYLKRWAHGPRCRDLTGPWAPAEYGDVAFSPDGRRVAAGQVGGAVRVWEAESGRLALTLRGCRGAVAAVAFRPPDGRVLAAGDESGWVRLYDAASGGALHAWQAHAGNVAGLRYSPDGRQLVTCGPGGPFKVWDADTGREVAGAPADSGGALDVAFRPDGTLVASAGADGTVRVADAAGGQVVRAYQGHRSGGQSVAFSPDGRRVASGGYDASLHVWDVDTGTREHDLTGHTEAVRGVTFSPDGRRLASAGGEGPIRLWDARSGDELLVLRGHTAAVRRLAFSPDGHFLASVGSDGAVKLWDAFPPAAAEYERQALAGHDGPVHAVAVSPDGTLVAAAGREPRITVWEWATGTVRYALAGHAGGVEGLAFSPDGRLLASAGRDRAVRLWDAATGREVRAFACPAWARAVRFSPDGRRFAVAVGDREKSFGIRFFDTATGAEAGPPLDAEFGEVVSLDYSPDGRHLAARMPGQYVPWVTLWEVNGRFVRNWCIAGFGIAFSPDGRLLAATGRGDGVLKVCEVDSGRELLDISDAARPYAVAFHPDGRRLATGNADGTATLWDAGSGRALRTFRGHSRAVSSLAFSRDGHWVVSGSQDGSVRVWDADLTPEQWYGPQARDIVAERFDKLFLRQEVLESLRADPELGSEVRAAALALARDFEESPGPLKQAALKILVLTEPGQTRAEDYARALAWAEAACRLDPEAAGNLTTLGVAQYRAGRYADAAATLQRDDELNAAKYAPNGSPANVAFRAMALYRLGRHEEARQFLARLRGLKKLPTWANHPLVLPFYQEAGELIEGVQGKKDERLGEGDRGAKKKD
jgi:eukaryotic-like serine/threonine-protein kinase